MCVSALSDRGLKCSDITHVVCSHGHSDHVGNQNLFPDALFVVGYDIVQGDVYYEHNLAKVSVWYSCQFISGVKITVRVRVNPTWLALLNVGLYAQLRTRLHDTTGCQTD